MSVLSRLVSIMVLAGLIASSGSAAAASQQEPSAPALDLSSDVESPGSEVVLTLSLSVPNGVEIGKTASEITYPGKLLAFLEARRGLSAEAVNAEVTATTQASDTDPENSILRVTIAARERDWLPPGTMADLVFKISQQAPVEQTVALKNNVTAWTAGSPPTPIESMTGRGGEVKVTATPPVFACFFYMH